MTPGDEYRVKAAELRAQALHEIDPQTKADREALAAAYLRLAEQAESNSKTDVVYETPPLKDHVGARVRRKRT